jgi:glycerol kinase
MQFQSDITQQKLRAAKKEELSAIGAAYLAGLAAGISREDELFGQMEYEVYTPSMELEKRSKYVERWNDALSMIM